MALNEIISMFQAAKDDSQQKTKESLSDTLKILKRNSKEIRRDDSQNYTELAQQHNILCESLIRTYTYMLEIEK